MSPLRLFAVDALHRVLLLFEGLAFFCRPGNEGVRCISLSRGAQLTIAFARP
jgi:hypothetical protein